jgi:hypothetical protein
MNYTPTLQGENLGPHGEIVAPQGENMGVFVTPTRKVPVPKK